MCPGASEQGRGARRPRPATSPGVDPRGWLGAGVLFDGVVKMDLQTGEVTGRWDCPPGWFVVSEPTFVAKQDSSAGDGDQVGVRATLPSQPRSHLRIPHSLRG